MFEHNIEKYFGKILENILLENTFENIKNIFQEYVSKISLENIVFFIKSTLLLLLII